MTVKKFVVFMLILSLSFFTFACTPDSPGNGDAPPGDTHITIGTASVGGAFYPVGVSVASLWNREVEGVRAVAIATAGSPQNVEWMGTGELQVSVLRDAEGYEAIAGINRYEGIATPWLKSIAPLYFSGLQIVATKRSGVTSLTQLEGKRVAVGPIGSGGEKDSLDMLTLYGFTYDDIHPEYVEASQAAEMMKDGHVDVAILGLTMGAAVIQELMLTGDVIMLSLEDEYLDEYVAEHPMFTRFVIPANYYENQNYEVVTRGAPTVLAIHEDIPADLVYELTKALAENEDHVRSAHSIVSDWTQELASQMPTVPYHEGALRYWKEVGIVP